MNRLFSLLLEVLVDDVLDEVVGDAMNNLVKTRPSCVELLLLLGLEYDQFRCCMCA